MVSDNCINFLITGLVTINRSFQFEGLLTKSTLAPDILHTHILWCDSFRELVDDSYPKELFAVKIWGRFIL
jgi:hypothetical protein